MRLKAAASFCAFLILSVSVCSTAQGQSTTYAETRKLLLKVERAPANDALKKLFKEDGIRMDDLIRALYDADEKVSLNSQTALKYLGDQQSLAAVEEWYAFRRKHGENYWESPVGLVSEARYLGVDSKNPEKLVLKNLYSRYKTDDVSATVIAYNKHLKTALIEVIIGNVFTSGEHVTVGKEGGKWRLVSKSHVWDS